MSSYPSLLFPRPQGEGEGKRREREVEVEEGESGRERRTKWRKWEAEREGLSGGVVKGRGGLDKRRREWKGRRKLGIN